MSRDAPVDYLLHLADNALVLGQRNAEWCGHGPVLEEDIALANISLDLIGQSRLLYQHAAALIGGGATEDTLAYFRDANQFRNYTMLELPHHGTAGRKRRGRSRLHHHHSPQFPVQQLDAAFHVAGSNAFFFFHIYLFVVCFPRKQHQAAVQEIAHDRHRVVAPGRAVPASGPKCGSSTIV